MMPRAKLKACPFCGCEDIEIDDVGCGLLGTCQAKGCGATGPMVGYEDIHQTRGASGRKLRAEAARLWNARVEVQRAD